MRKCGKPMAEMPASCSATPRQRPARCDCLQAGLYIELILLLVCSLQEHAACYGRLLAQQCRAYLTGPHAMLA